MHFPRYTSSFGMFEYAYPLTDGVRALMPPQGLLVIAAALPASWEVRFVDENIEPARPEDLEWPMLSLSAECMPSGGRSRSFNVAFMPPAKRRCSAGPRFRPAPSFILV
jgi:hypothetical protein